MNGEVVLVVVEVYRDEQVRDHEARLLEKFEKGGWNGLTFEEQVSLRLIVTLRRERGEASSVQGVLEKPKEER